MVPFLNNQKGYNCSATHSVSLFVSTTTRSDCFRPYQLALDPSRPPLFVASSEFEVSADRSIVNQTPYWNVSRIRTYPALERTPHWNVLRIGTHSVLERIHHWILLTSWFSSVFAGIPYWNASCVGTAPSS